MERSTIETKTADLPLSSLGEIQADHEIWEQTDGGAHFKVTRHELPVKQSIEILALSISGELNERRRIISEFAQVFGGPSSVDVTEAGDHIDIVAWITHK